MKRQEDLQEGIRLDRRQNAGAGRKTYERTVLCISAL